MQHLLSTGRRRSPADDLAAVATADPARALRSSTQAIREVIGTLDPAAVIATPGGPLPVDVALGNGTLETLVHAWDLAVATGRPDPVPPADAAALVLELEPLAGTLHTSGMFAPAEAVDRDAGPVRTLLALTGRRPCRT